MKRMEPCPKCGSSKTGLILPEGASSWKRELKRGHYSKFVSPEEYRTYYEAFGITGCCCDCGYEFRGELMKIADTKADRAYREQLEEFSERKITRGPVAVLVRYFQYKKEMQAKLEEEKKYAEQKRKRG